MKKVYIEYASVSYHRLFAGLGYQNVYSPEAADFICFTGGADVSPGIYGDVAHKTTHNDLFRDDKETRLFNWALEKRIPMVGICRGGQFLNVMSGGRMYQDVSEHGRSHPIVDKRTGEIFYVTSTHHQMMLPQGKYQLVASSNLRGYREWYEGEVFKRDIFDEDIEVVWYESTSCLCFQPHPEMYQEEHVFNPMRTYFHSLLKEFFGG